MKRIYYEKLGRRYQPVAEYDSDLLDALPKGAHLVMVYPGGASRLYGINPAYAPMIAAGRVASDAIIKAIHAASEAKPTRTPLTKKQAAAWEEMKAVFEDGLFGLQFSSIHDLAEAGVKAMQEEADKLLTNPSVRLAYNKFLMIVELTKEKQND